MEFLWIQRWFLVISAFEAPDRASYRIIKESSSRTRHHTKFARNTRTQIKDIWCSDTRGRLNNAGWRFKIKKENASLGNKSPWKSEPTSLVRTMHRVLQAALDYEKYLALRQRIASQSTHGAMGSDDVVKNTPRDSDWDPCTYIHTIQWWDAFCLRAWKQITKIIRQPGTRLLIRFAFNIAIHLQLKDEKS